MAERSQLDWETTIRERAEQVIYDGIMDNRDAHTITGNLVRTGLLPRPLEPAPAASQGAPGEGLTPDVGTMAEELRSRLPKPPYEETPIGTIWPNFDFAVSDDGASWDVEWCPLDPKRNVALCRPTLAEALQAVLEHDDAALASQGEGDGDDG